MDRSRLTMYLLLISIVLVAISLVLPQQLTEEKFVFQIVAGSGFILFAAIASYLAYQQRSGQSSRGGQTSARTFCLIAVIILVLFGLFVFAPFDQDGNPIPFDLDKMLALGLWVVSSILSVIGGLVYGDQKTKAWI